jgi:hypothetical protein
MRRIVFLLPSLALLLMATSGCATVQEWYGSMRSRASQRVASIQSPIRSRQASRQTGPTEQIASPQRRLFPAPPKVDDDSPYYDTVVLDPKSRARRNESLEQMPSETIEPRLFEPPSL